MRYLICVIMFCIAVVPVLAAEPAWPIYWVKQTPSSPGALNTIPDEDVFNGSTPESVAKFFANASDNNLPPHPLSETDFFERVKSFASTKRPVILFVHGCCASTESSLNTAKELSKHSNVPVIMYRWPAFGNLTNYLENENVCDRSMGRAVKFFEKLETVLPPEQTIILGHSMGTRLVIDFLDRRDGQNKTTLLRHPFKMCILAGADAEAERFCQQSKKIARGSSTTYVLVHRQDFALMGSSALHQLYPRLGAFEKINLRDLPNHQLLVLDISELSPGRGNHAMPFDLIGVLTKKTYAPLGLVVSKYYVTPNKQRTWTVSTTPPKLDPRRVLTRSTPQSSTKTSLTPREMELLKDIVRKSKQQRQQ